MHPKNYLNRIIINKTYNGEVFKKRKSGIAKASPQPAIVAEREIGLSPKRRKLLKETMRRHDKALRMLANI